MKIINYVVGPLSTNSYIVYDEETRESLIIDPGSDELVSRVEELMKSGLKFCGIIATHGHIDHIAGVKALREITGAKFMLHKSDIEVMDISLDWGLELGYNLNLDDIKPDQLYEAEEIIGLGSYGIEIIHTPGHTPGSVVLYIPSLKIAFTGDTLFRESVGRTDLMGGSWSALKESIKKLINRLSDDTVIYPGHGPSSTIAYELRNNIFVKRIMKGS
ncbi:MAG: MBL fold metallo-hydrolase [Sulfolobales archaeon]